MKGLTLHGLGVNGPSWEINKLVKKAEEGYGRVYRY